MTKEEAMNLKPGDCVLVCKSDRLTPPKSVEKILGQIVTVYNVEDYCGDVFVHTRECSMALFWDEVDFAKPVYIDEHLDENIAGNILDLFGGEN